MPRMSFSVTTPMPPSAVVAAVTDFSERRPQLWPALDASAYRVHSLGSTSAEVTEGGAPFPGVWARERYDWSQPGVVRATIVESSVFRPGGTWTLEALPAADAGTVARVTWDRRPRGLRGMLLTLLVVTVGRGALAADLRRVLEAHQRLTAQPRPIRSA